MEAEEVELVLVQINLVVVVNDRTKETIQQTITEHQIDEFYNLRTQQNITSYRASENMNSTLIFKGERHIIYTDHLRDEFYTDHLRDEFSEISEKEMQALDVWKTEH